MYRHFKRRVEYWVINTRYEVMDAINTLKEGNSHGIENLPIELIKHGGNICCKYSHCSVIEFMDKQNMARRIDSITSDDNY